MSDLGQVKASAWLAVVVNTASFTLAAFATMGLLLQLLSLFGFVGLGPESNAGASLSRAGFGSYMPTLGYPAAMIVGGIVLVSALRNQAGGVWSYRTALTPIPVLGMVAYEMLSYRLLGFIALGVATWAYVHYVTHQKCLRLLVYACLTMVLFSVLPFDVSFQNVPGNPRWLPTVYGLPSLEEHEAAQRGEHVIVGGCSTAYFVPTWVWVW